VFGYVLLGVGALGVGLGTYFAFHAAGARGDAEKLCPESNGSRWCTVQAKDSLDQDQRSSLLADISFGLGAASAMTGLVLVLTSGSSKKETEDALRLQATPVAGGGEVDLVGRF
jgi:hypothetical protein